MVSQTHFNNLENIYFSHTQKKIIKNTKYGCISVLHIFNKIQIGQTCII